VRVVTVTALVTEWSQRDAFKDDPELLRRAADYLERAGVRDREEATVDSDDELSGQRDQ
jgi:hypothetical protein